MDTVKNNAISNKTKNNEIRGKPRFSVGQFSIHLIIILFCLFCVVPILLVVSISLSDEMELVKHGYRLIPEKLSFSAYSYILKRPGQILNAYMITIIVTLAGSSLGLLISCMLAYTTTRRDYKYRNITSFIVFFSTMFNGGLIPTYILISKYLHMKNTLFVLFVPYLVNVGFIFLMRGFLLSIPGALIESAKIDGAGEFRIFFRIVIPLSKAGLATVGLFYALMYWNDWWLSLLYIDNNRLVTLQFLLYRILSNISFLSKVMSQGIAKNVGADIVKLPQLSARMAMCVMAAGPMLFVFPFFQKYFVRGITIGSLKG